MGEEKGWRRSIRLEGYDYAQPGAYFITTCARTGEEDGLVMLFTGKRG